ncbi:MAG: porin family protein [Salinivirgaceae bacterium]|jgi:hypothetical protein
MKQIITIVILAFISLVNTIAQDFKRIDYLFDFGTTLSIPYKKTIEIWPDFDGHPQTDYSTNFGYFLEFMVSYNLNTNYAIGTGLNYNYGSLKVDNKITLFENKGNLTNSYLTLPLLIKYRLTDKIPISLSVGTYLSVLMGAHEKGTTYIDTAGIKFSDPNDPVLMEIEPEQKYNTDIKQDYSSMDYGLLIQLEYEFELKKGLKGIILSRFNYGLKNVITNDMLNYSIATEWKNYNMLIGFGVRL